VVQLPRQLDLAAKARQRLRPRQKLGVQQLERHLALHVQIGSAIHRAEAPLANGRFDAVAPRNDLSQLNAHASSIDV
jgi:hypothetical protein